VEKNMRTLKLTFLVVLLALGACFEDEEENTNKDSAVTVKDGGGNPEQLTPKPDRGPAKDKGSVKDKTGPDQARIDQALKDKSVAACDRVNPDKPVPWLDKAVVTPDKAVVTPDKAVVTPDKAIPTPDKAVPDQTIPDQAPPGDITVPPAPAGMVFIHAAGKTFTMGGPYIPAPHKVTFTKNFFMDTHEVTRAKYKALMGADLPAFFTAQTLPAQNVTWYMALRYCNARSKKEGLNPVYSWTSEKKLSWGYYTMTGVKTDFAKNGYRLPTEAEWEFAYRAGTTTQYYWGNTSNDAYLWHTGNSGKKPQVPGLKKPNAWGLYDMAGNILEWVNDYNGPAATTAQTDPTGPATQGASGCVLRGGSWYDFSSKAKAAYRRGDQPQNTYSKYDIYGFRTVRKAP